MEMGILCRRRRGKEFALELGENGKHVKEPKGNIQGVGTQKGTSSPLELGD